MVVKHYGAKTIHFVVYARVSNMLHYNLKRGKNISLLTETKINTKRKKIKVKYKIRNLVRIIKNCHPLKVNAASSLPKRQLAPTRRLQSDPLPHCFSGECDCDKEKWNSTRQRITSWIFRCSRLEM